MGIRLLAAPRMMHRTKSPSYLPRKHVARVFQRALTRR